MAKTLFFKYRLYTLIYLLNVCRLSQAQLCDDLFPLLWLCSEDSLWYFLTSWQKRDKMANLLIWRASSPCHHWIVMRYISSDPNEVLILRVVANRPWCLVSRFKKIMTLSSIIDNLQTLFDRHVCNLLSSKVLSTRNGFEALWTICLLGLGSLYSIWVLEMDRFDHFFLLYADIL